jgi:hypothetical protein
MWKCGASSEKKDQTVTSFRIRPEWTRYTLMYIVVTPLQKGLWCGNDYTWSFSS